MLNEDKIRIMSRCAMYEKSKGKEDIKIHHHFKSDYIRLNTLKTLIGTTICFVMCLGIYMILNAEYYMTNLFSMNLNGFMKEILIAYAIVFVIFGIISVVFYGWKYADAHKRVLGYYENIQALKDMNSEMEDKE